jgi:hypothetical protein
MVQLADIYREFQGIESIPEKIQYLRDASNLGLPFDINFEGLIQVWTNELTR